MATSVIMPKMKGDDKPKAGEKPAAEPVASPQSTATSPAKALAEAKRYRDK